MTTTTETRTIPTTQSGWLDWHDEYALDNFDPMRHWGYRDVLSEVMADMRERFVNLTPQTLADTTDRDLLRAWGEVTREHGHEWYLGDSEEERHMAGWLREVAQAWIGVPLPEPPPAPEPGTIDWEAAFNRQWENWSGLNDAQRARFREIVAHLYGKWSTKQDSPRSKSRAYQQAVQADADLDTTSGRTKGSTWDYRFEAQAHHFLYAYMYRHLIRGDDEPLPPIPSGDGVGLLLENLGLDREDGRFNYMRRGTHSFATEWRRYNLPSEDEGKRLLRQHITSYGYTTGEEEAQAMWDVASALVRGTPLPSVEPPEGLTDDGVLDHLLSLTPDRGEWRVGAVTKALAEFRDMLAVGEVDSPDAEVFRRMVRSWGDTRWTGGGKRRLTSALAPVVEAHKGRGLTAEQWQERFTRQREQVAAVAGRYGEVNNLCKQLEAALTELGMDKGRMKAPTREVMFKSPQGMLVKIKVQTWHDTVDYLRAKASQVWDSMSQEQRAAAIVEPGKPHVPWNEMVAQ